MKPIGCVHQLEIFLGPLLPERFVGGALDQIHALYITEYVIDVVAKRVGRLGGKNQEMTGIKARLVNRRAFFQILAQLLILGDNDVELLKTVRGWRETNYLKDQLHILVREIFLSALNFLQAWRKSSALVISAAEMVGLLVIGVLLFVA